MKNETSFGKERIRPSLDRLTGGIYTRIHSIKGFQKKKRSPRCKLACGGETFSPLTLDVPHTKILCFGLWVTRYLDRGICTMLFRKLHLEPFHLQTSPQLFVLCHQMKTNETFFGESFQLASSPGNDMH